MTNRTITDKLKEHDTRRPFVSFEFYPPKTDKGVATLKRKLRDVFAPQSPLFIDFTWGAGGSTADLTLELATEMAATGLDVNMHLTCTNMRRELVDKALRIAKDAGIRNICALRGDPPHGEERWTVADDGFSCALDLVNYIRAEYGDTFCIAVAGYPEGHPNVILPVPEGRSLSASEEARVVEIVDEAGEKSKHCCSDADFEREITYLKAKVDAGADLIITQLFYDAQVFLTFVQQCRSVGITVPIIPGVMPVSTFGGLKRMTTFCKTRIPTPIRTALEAAHEQDIKTESKHTNVRSTGVSLVVSMLETILSAAQDDTSLHIPGFHFYTLNSEMITFQLLQALHLLIQ